MSHLETTKAQLKRLASDSLESALKEMERLLSPQSPRFDAFLLLAGQFKKCREEFLLGMLSQEQSAQTYARLMSAFLQLTGDLIPADLNSEKITAQKPTEKRGELLYHVPHMMQVMREEKCTVRIAWTEAALFENWMRRKDDVRRSNLRIAEIMGVELLSHSEDAPFSIKSLHSTVQFLDEEDYTEWIFYVKPLRAGNYPLVIRISVIEMRDNREVKRELVLEEQINVSTETPQVEAGPEKMVRAPVAYFSAGGGLVEAPAFVADTMRRYGALMTLFIVAAGIYLLPDWGKKNPNDVFMTNTERQLDTLLLVLPPSVDYKTEEVIIYGGVSQIEIIKKDDLVDTAQSNNESQLNDFQNLAPNFNREDQIAPSDSISMFSKDSVGQRHYEAEMKSMRLVLEDKNRNTTELQKGLLEINRHRRSLLADAHVNYLNNRSFLQKDPSLALRIAQYPHKRYPSGFPKFSPDGSSILTANKDAEVRLLDLLGNHTNIPTSGRIVISSEGNIGIGTANPSSPLSITGSIISEEVKVGLSRPDYIFYPEYKLLSLDSVFSGMNRNEHLSEMGTDVDSTKYLQFISEELLKKIEELNREVDNFKNQTDKMALDLKKMEALTEPSKVKRKGLFDRFWDWLIFWK